MSLAQCAAVTCGFLIAIAVATYHRKPRNRRIKRDTLPPPSLNCQRNGVECAGKV